MFDVRRFDDEESSMCCHWDVCLWYAFLTWSNACSTRDASMMVKAMALNEAWQSILLRWDVMRCRHDDDAHDGWCDPMLVWWLRLHRYKQARTKLFSLPLILKCVRALAYPAIAHPLVCCSLLTCGVLELHRWALVVEKLITLQVLFTLRFR